MQEPFSALAAAYSVIEKMDLPVPRLHSYRNTKKHINSMSA